MYISKYNIDIVKHMPVDYKFDNRLSPEVKKFLIDLNASGGTLKSMGVAKARLFLDEAQAQAQTQDVIDFYREAFSDDFSIYRIDSNLSTYAKSSCAIFVHGGGWVIGSVQDHARLIYDISEVIQIPIYALNYSLSPEEVYPTAELQLRQLIDALAQDYTSIHLIGNSAGGALCVSVMKHYTSRIAPIKSINLLWPVCDYPSSFRKSYQEFGEDRYLTEVDMNWFFNCYDPDDSALPLRIDTEVLKTLPPTMIHLADNDPLHDEGKEFGEKLSNLSVDCCTLSYGGVIHDWGLLNALSDIPQTKSLINNIASFIYKH